MIVVNDINDPGSLLRLNESICGRRLYSQALLDILRLIASMVEAARLPIYSRTSSSLRGFGAGAFGVLLEFYCAAAV